jgi:hypothetical protein
MTQLLFKTAKILWGTCITPQQPVYMRKILTFQTVRNDIRGLVTLTIEVLPPPSAPFSSGTVA